MPFTRAHIVTTATIGFGLLCALVLGILGLGVPLLAEAGVVEARSSALDLSLNVTFTPPGGLTGILTLSPQNQVSAPPDSSNTINNLSLSGPGGSLTVASDQVAATTVVNTPAGEAFGRSTLQGFQITIPTLSFGLDATTLESTANANETNFVITTTGTTTLAGAVLHLFGNDFALTASPAPNTGVATGLSGVTVTLNEQQIVQNSSVASITVDAIHIAFNGAVAPDQTVLNGNVFLGRSVAALVLDPALQQPPQPVPEPGTLLLVGAGVLGVRLLRARRRGASS